MGKTIKVDEDVLKAAIERRILILFASTDLYRWAEDEAPYAAERVVDEIQTAQDPGQSRQKEGS